MNMIAMIPLLFRTHQGAEEVLKEMRLELDAWDCVDVEFFYEVAKVELPPYITIKDNYGWKNLDKVTIVDTQHGALLNLPEPELLD